MPTHLNIFSFCTDGVAEGGMVAEGQEGGGGGGGREGGTAECEGALREKRLRAISQVPTADLRSAYVYGLKLLVYAALSY